MNLISQRITKACHMQWHCNCECFKHWVLLNTHQYAKAADTHGPKAYPETLYFAFLTQTVIILFTISLTIHRHETFKGLFYSPGS